MPKKYFLILVCSFVFLLFIYYTFVFFNNYDRIHTDNLPTAEDIIADFDEIGEDYKTAVRNTYHFFSLDSSSNFNPKSPLLRMDALIIIDIIGSQNVKRYGSSANTTVPYFNDFRSSDAYADVIRRVVAHIDQMPDFPNHYEILGYELNKNEPITRLEFLMLISSFFGKGNQEAPYTDVPAEYSPYIASLNSKGIISAGSALNMEKPMTREEAALIAYRTLQALQ